MVAKAKYTPMGLELSANSSLVQASIALDVAAQLAVDSRDIEGLVSVAAHFIALSERLCDKKGDIEVTELESETEEKDSVPVGFTRVEA